MGDCAPATTLSAQLFCRVPRSYEPPERFKIVAKRLSLLKDSFESRK